MRFRDHIEADKRTQWLDGARDVGLFVTSKHPLRHQQAWNRVDTRPGIFALGVEKPKTKNYITDGKLLSVNNIMETSTRVTGKKVYYEPITYEEFADVAAGFMGPAFRQCALEMKQWAWETPEGRINYGCSDPEEDISPELGVTVTGIEEWIKSTSLVGSPLS